MTLPTERMAEIANLAIRLQQISSCAAVTSSGETVLHHTHVDEILSALHDVTAELLANREAQPVAWEMRYWNSGYNMWGEWERITAEQHAEMSVKHAADNDYEFRVLYDAPPAPKSNAADWGINMQTGTPILAYKNCSVIESEQAHYVLSLINCAAPPAPAVPDESVNRDNFEKWVADYTGHTKGFVSQFRSGARYQVGSMWNKHWDTWSACRAAMLAQPVSQGCKLPDGWIACSEQDPVADGAY